MREFFTSHRDLNASLLSTHLILSVLMIWICEHGHEFKWIRKGKETKPEECPMCRSSKIDVRDV
jgi:hypothetical protein